jgi:hypothetical protein
MASDQAAAMIGTVANLTGGIIVDQLKPLIQAGQRAASGAPFAHIRYAAIHLEAQSSAFFFIELGVGGRII